MEADDRKRVDVLTHLICVNKDRIAGYVRISEKLEGSIYEQIEPLFLQRIHESQVFIFQLSEAIMKLGKKPVESTTVLGKFYRMWLDMKAAFNGIKLKSLFEECEYSEGAAWKAYDNALALEIWSRDVGFVLTSQWQAIKNSYQSMKQYSSELKHARVQNV